MLIFICSGVFGYHYAVFSPCLCSICCDISQRMSLENASGREMLNVDMVRTRLGMLCSSVFVDVQSCCRKDISNYKMYSPVKHLNRCYAMMLHDDSKF